MICSMANGKGDIMGNMTYTFPILDVNKIWEGLFQGAMPPVGYALKRHGFDVLVLAAACHQDAEAYKDIVVICAPGEDDEDPQRLESTLTTWQEAALDVAQHVREGRKVLVTCMAGLNRSGFITALALHHLTGWSGEVCVEHIRKRRKMALCNKTFAKYICENIQNKAKEEET